MPSPTPSQEEIARAAAALRAGDLVAFPTETVYGLGADATNDRAVAAIFTTKGRPRFNPLIIHVPDFAAAQHYGQFTNTAAQLARTFWPGPLTLVVPQQPDAGISDLVTTGLDTIAIRIPSHPIAQALLAQTEHPVAAPSANRSGRVSATSASHVRTDFEGSDLIVLDAGPTQHGLESTIIDASGDEVVLLRPGAITAEMILTETGLHVVERTKPAARPNAPGQLESHYAPHAQVRLNISAPEPGEALLAFGADVPPHDGPMINLSASGDTTEAAINLFAALRTLDARGCATIAVMPIPETGLGAAINDRLRRAAAPRP